MEVLRLRSQFLGAAVGQLVAATTAAVAALIDLLDAASNMSDRGPQGPSSSYGLSLQEAVEVRHRIGSLEELYVQHVVAGLRSSCRLLSLATSSMTLSG